MLDSIIIIIIIIIIELGQKHKVRADRLDMLANEMLWIVSHN
jgi:hypothetical protein